MAADELEETRDASTELETESPEADDDSPLRVLLKEFFGFKSFRPLQEEIVADSLSGRDVLAVLPTGGGKSLCFQLPALARDGLTVVISPLIALMKDQVDALVAMGVNATFLNSTLDAADSRARIQDIEQGLCRLLYVAPERLMLPNMLAALQRWNVKMIAVDEAHCISEWGHDFRPEYRQMSSLRTHFPGVPLMALTATATPRVQDDIVKALKLEKPSRYVASFNRPNLAYRVIAKKDAFDQVLEFIKSKPQECGIIYCHSRKSAEQVAGDLRANGVKAAPYHAGMEHEARTRNQELFLRDEVNVICATIAFGMGINKPNVRYVIHYDLPKNIEGYYQETGRAGRDGLPSECLLLLSRGDVAKQMRFIDEKPSPQEQDLARKQLWKMVEYAEGTSCRRAFLLGYFGEKFMGVPCGGCDNCNAPRDQYDGTVDAQKFLSCIYRIKERNPSFGAGMKYSIDILTGAETDLIRSWEHNTLSTYGIGKDKSKDEWQSIARQLIHGGYIREKQDGKYTRLEITPLGKDVLLKRATVMIAKPAVARAVEKSKSTRGDMADRAKRGEIECDEALFEKLRDLRKRLADERDVPAYIVFSDVSLRQMARDYPTQDHEFSRISGVGERKRQEFGAAFMSEIAEHLKASTKKSFDSSPAPSAPAETVKRGLNSTARQTLRMFQDGQRIEHIASERKLAESTIYTHLCDAIDAGERIEIDRALTPEQRMEISAVFEKIGTFNLTGALELLGGKDGPYNFNQLKLFRTWLEKNKPQGA